MEEDLEVPIDITGFEYARIKENLELFNDTVVEGEKLTFDEFVSLVFETALLEEKLDSKYDYLNVLKAEVKQLEDELMAKYSTGLNEYNDDVIECRKKALKDSSYCINGCDVGFEK